MTQDNSLLRWKFQVREFVPQPGDSLERTWLSRRTGSRQYHPVTPYGLLSMKDTAGYLWKFLEKDLHIVVTEFVGKEGTWLAETYKMAQKHSREAEVSLFIHDTTLKPECLR